MTAWSLSASSWTGALHPRKFWVAWEWGAETTRDPVASDWDFWTETTTALEELERRYHVPSLAAGDADAADRREGFKPIA